jgi:hypothetical protein
VLLIFVHGLHTYLVLLDKMVSDCCLMLNEQFVSYIIGEQVTFR